MHEEESALKKEKISVYQALALLLLSRMFSLLDYSPDPGLPMSGRIPLWANLVSSVLSVLALLPGIWLYRRGNGQNFLEDALSRSRWLGTLCILYPIAFITLSLMATLVGFESFLVHMVYPGAGKIAIILTLSGAGFAAASFGLSGMARASTILFALFVPVFLFIFGLALPEMELQNLYPLSGNMLPAVFRTSMLQLSHTEELYFFLLLLPHIRTTHPRKVLWFPACWLLIAQSFGFLLITVLGDYGMTQDFPYYSIAAVTQTKILQRFDSFYTILWVITAFVAVALRLWMLCHLCRMLLPKKGHRLLFGGIAALSALGSLVILHLPGEGADSIGSDSLFLLLITTGLPLLLLFSDRFRKEGTHAPPDSSADTAH